MRGQSSSTSGNRNRVSGFLRLCIFSLLTAAFAFTSAHAQTVAYVANAGSNSVSVIDTTTNTVTANIPLASSPVAVVFSPDGSRAYVGDSTNNGGFPPFPNGTIYVIDTSTNIVVRTISLTNSEDGASLAITPDGTTLYASADTTGDALVIDIASGNVTATLPGIGGGAVVITPNGSTAYVSNRFNAVTAITTASNTVTATIPVGITFPATTQMAITPDGSFLYVPLFGPGQAVVIATATNSVVGTPISTVQGPFGVAITPDGAFAYVYSGISTGGVSVIRTADNTVVATVPAGKNLNGLAITPDNAFAYVTVSNSNSVAVIDTATNTVVANVPVGSVPVGIAIANLSTPFAAFTIDNLVINNNLHEQGDFTLGANTGGIDLANQPLTLTVNDFSLTIPAGSFRQVGGNMHFVFNGTVNGLSVNFNLKAVNGSSSQFTYGVDVHGVSIGGPNPANVALKIGHNSGSTTAPF
jgi:YVTN family beta-propeller protein